MQLVKSILTAGVKCALVPPHSSVESVIRSPTPSISSNFHANSCTDDDKLRMQQTTQRVVHARQKIYWGRPTLGEAFPKTRISLFAVMIVQGWYRWLPFIRAWCLYFHLGTGFHSKAFAVPRCCPFTSQGGGSWVIGSAVGKTQITGSITEGKIVEELLSFWLTLRLLKKPLGLLRCSWSRGTLGV